MEMDSDSDMELYDDIDETIYGFKIKLINLKNEVQFIRAQCDQYDIKCWYDCALRLGSVNGSKNKMVCIVPKAGYYHIEYADNNVYSATLAIPDELSLGSCTVVKVDPHRTVVSSNGSSFEVDSTLSSAYTINGDWSGSGFDSYDIKFSIECQKLYNFMKQFKRSPKWDEEQYDDYIIDMMVMHNKLHLKIVDSSGTAVCDNTDSVHEYGADFKIRYKNINIGKIFSYQFIDLYEILRDNLIKTEIATMCLHQDMPLIMKVELASATVCMAVLPD